MGSRRSWVTALFVAWGMSVGSARAADPVRIGVLGLDNYQAVAYAQILNNPKATGDLLGVRVVAAFPDEPSTDIEESVTNLPKWIAQIQKFGVEIVPSVDELLRRCDAIMVMSVDGRRHRAQLQPVFAAKKPVYVGRPLTTTLAEAQAIFAEAERTKTPIWSSSQHRYSPGFFGMREHPEVGRVLGCDVYGGCPTEPHHPRFVWHALHGIETMYTIMGPGCVSVRCTSTPQAESITAVWSDGRVATYRGIKQGALKYSATVFGEKGVSTAGIYGHGVPVKGVVPTQDKYMGYEGIAIEMAKFYKSGVVPVTPAETLEIYAFMEAADRSIAEGGAEVKLADVLAKK